MASPSWIQKIRNWYNNHRNVPAEEPPFVQAGSWNFRRVIQQEFKEGISKNLEVTGLKSTSKLWVGKYQEEVTKIINKLGEDEVAKYTEVAKTWNEADLPEDLRMK